MTEREFKSYEHTCKLINSGNDMPELNDETIREVYQNTMGSVNFFAPYVPLMNSYISVSTTASTNSWGNSWAIGGSSSSYTYSGSATITCGSGTSSRTVVLPSILSTPK